LTDVSFIVGRDIGLMIRAFSAALEDENLLVRRGVLDLLIQSLRIGSAAVKMAPSDDRVILMRAATGVVLRRDLSLNRRLYTWLLGSEEKSDHQIAYFRDNALELLISTLKVSLLVNIRVYISTHSPQQEMFSPSGDYSESRPFKIFISLLDKWEIGASLTEGLVYDAFKAIQKLAESESETGDEVPISQLTLTFSSNFSSGLDDSKRSLRSCGTSHLLEAFL
jgi:Dopey, N-terminal